jgi:hypothetical protein
MIRGAAVMTLGGPERLPNYSFSHGALEISPGSSFHFQL